MSELSGIQRRERAPSDLQVMHPVQSFPNAGRFSQSQRYVCPNMTSPLRSASQISRLRGCVPLSLGGTCLKTLPTFLCPGKPL